MSPRPAARTGKGRSKAPFLVALLVVALVGVGVQQWLAATARAEQRATLLADIDAALRSDPLDLDGLSQFVARLRKEPDHATDRALCFAEARIELARGRAERARELFLGQVLMPGASADEQSWGARVLLRLHDDGAESGRSPAELLGPAASLAASAYDVTRDPADLMRAWQAAKRNGDHDRAAGFAATLALAHADTVPAQFVALAVAFDPAVGVAAVLRARAASEPSPAEVEAMLAAAELQQGNLAAATATIEAALQRAPGVAVVRYTAAVTFHGCVLAAEAGAPGRAAWAERRDAQIGWLRAEPGVEPALLDGLKPMADVR